MEKSSSSANIRGKLEIINVLKQNAAISVKLIWASTEEVHIKASWLKLDSVYSHSKNQLILCIVIFCGYHSTFF